MPIPNSLFHTPTLMRKNISKIADDVVNNQAQVQYVTCVGEIDIKTLELLVKSSIDDTEFTGIVMLPQGFNIKISLQDRLLAVPTTYASIQSYLALQDVIIDKVKATNASCFLIPMTTSPSQSSNEISLYFGNNKIGLDVTNGNINIISESKVSITAPLIQMKAP